MNFFIAGIMQGSKIALELHSQDYRSRLKNSILRAFPNANVYDPFERNRDSISYAPTTGKRVFLRHNHMCGTEIDVLVAFVPEASMGTAIEMWEAWKNGAFVASISPLVENWAIKFLSDIVYPDADSFERSLQTGEFARLVESFAPRAQRREQ